LYRRRVFAGDDVNRLNGQIDDRDGHDHAPALSGAPTPTPAPGDASLAASGASGALLALVAAPANDRFSGAALVERITSDIPYNWPWCVDLLMYDRKKTRKPAPLVCGRR
jgi:hypothetical protein